MHLSLPSRIAVCAAAVTLVLTAAARSASADVTDVVLVVDISADMGAEIAFMKSVLPGVQQQFDSYGDDVRFGLVEFVETSALTQNLVDFNGFVAPGGAWDLLGADSAESLEQGSTAILTQNPSLDFRHGSKRHVVLITSEADGSPSADKTAAALIFNEMGPAFWLMDDAQNSVRQSYMHLSANGHSFTDTGQPLYFHHDAFAQLGDLIHEQNFLTPAVPEPSAVMGCAAGGMALLLRRRRAC